MDRFEYGEIMFTPVTDQDFKNNALKITKYQIRCSVCKRTEQADDPNHFRQRYSSWVSTSNSRLVCSHCISEHKKVLEKFGVI